MSTLNSSAGKGWFWVAFEQFGQRGLLLIVGMIQARLMDPADFGLIASISIFVLVAQSLIDSGIGQCVIQKADPVDRDYTAFFWSNLCMSLIMSVMLLLFAGKIADFYETPKLKIIIRIFSLVIFFMNAGRVQVVILTRNLNFKKISLIGTCSNLIGCCVGVTLALIGWGVWALVWQQVTINASRAILFWVIMPWKPIGPLEWSAVRDLYSFGLPLLSAQLVQSVAGQISNVLIAKRFNATLLGLYDRGKLIPGSVGISFGAVFSRVNFPILSKMQGSDDDYKKSYKQFLKVGASVIFVMMVAMGFMGHQIIEIVLGKKWLEATPYFQLSCVVFAVYVLYMINLDILRSKGLTGLYFKYNTFFSLVQIGCIISGIHWGIIGMIVGDIIGRSIGLLALMQCVHSRTCIKLSWQIKVLVEPLLGSVLLAVSLCFLNAFVRDYWTHIILSGLLSFTVMLILLYSSLSLRGKYTLGDLSSRFRNRK